MADFKTHVTFSSAIGAGYAVVAKGMGFDLSTAILAGGLCGVSGMLPDIDSDSGKPRRESLTFAAAVIPLLMMDRFKQVDLTHDQIVLCGVLMYVAIRFWLANMIGRWSVHRGMWHSIPAVLIFAGLAFLISGSPSVFDRYLKAAAVGLGAFSHLLLDEIYSINTSGFVPKLKKSFGTAIKFFGPDPKANFSVYAKLAVVALMVGTEPMVIDRIQMHNPQLAAKLRGTASKVGAIEERLAQRTEQVLERGAAAEASQPRPNWSSVFQSSPSPAPTQPAQTQQAFQQPVPPFQQSPQFQPTPLPPSTPAWFAPPGTGGGSFSPNRSAASGGPFNR